MAWGKSGIETREHRCSPVPHHTYKDGKPNGSYYVCRACGRRM